jgi:four helix bundle protein
MEGIMSKFGQRFRDLRVWSESIDLARDVYRLTAQFPREERFGLSSQLRRAAVSVASNIAEGSVRSSRKDFRHFVEISIGSLAEMEMQLEIAQGLHARAADQAQIESQVQRVRMMLYRLHESLSSGINAATPTSRFSPE